MNISNDWVFGGFWRGLCKDYYEIYYENFIVDVGCGLSESGFAGLEDLQDKDF